MNHLLLINNNFNNLICPVNTNFTANTVNKPYQLERMASTYRPRGAFARALFEKVHNDEYLDGYDTSQWYKLSKTLPEKYQKRFISLDAPDVLTLEWLEQAKELSANLWLQIWHLVAKLFLGIFMTQTDINGWLKRGSMFILSEVQFKKLLSIGGFRLDNFAVNNEKLIDILDIGAGDGEVTVRLAKSIIQMDNSAKLKVFATETSWTMRKRLEKRKFTVLDNINDVNNIHLISCLNVLDRCADPHQILSDIHRALAPNGRVLIALVLPYSHYVESSSVAFLISFFGFLTDTSHMPLNPLLPHWPAQQRLPFDQEANAFFEQLEIMGFRIEAWTKAPYLCEGDLRQSFYWLIDLVVVLSKL